MVLFFFFKFEDPDSVPRKSGNTCPKKIWTNKNIDKIIERRNHDDRDQISFANVH